MSREMASKVLDGALDKISKKYPNFSAESGKKVVDSLQDVYKSYKKRKQTSSESKSATEHHALVDIPQDANGEGDRRDSFYENFEDYYEEHKTTQGSTQNSKFPCPNGESSSSSTTAPPTYQPNGIPRPDDTSPLPNHGLSNNPPAATDSEKKELIPTSSPTDCPYPPGPPRPPDAPPAVRSDISQYLQKKSLAQGMMDLALLSANTNQLRYILDSRSDNAYFSVSLTLIISSLVLQIVVGLMLVWNSSYNVQRRSGFASAEKINNLSVFGVFLITLINVFVSTFGNVPGSSAASSTSSSTVAPKSDAGVGIETTTMISAISSAAPAPVDVPPPPEPVDVPFE